MSRLFYQDKRFNAKTMEVIDTANDICADYAQQGFDLTLRQLYYQFVARGFLPNKQTEYKRLGSIINDARLAGLIDWDYITDRTRNVESVGHYSSPGSVIKAAARSYRRDLWADQDQRVEVWIEKEALAGVIEPTCNRLDVAFFACRGYVSQSEMWGASQRLQKYIREGQQVTILHLGDHDPSGIDMTRDIQDRLNIFCSGDWSRWLIEQYEQETGKRAGDDPDAWKAYVNAHRHTYRSIKVKRIALTMDQVEEYDPPPNPAKSTDARFEGYLAEHGDSSWELDALDPATLSTLIEEEVGALCDDDLMNEAIEREGTERELVEEASRRWEDVRDFLEEADEAS